MMPTSTNKVTNEPLSRSTLRHARRVVVKLGTSVVTNEDGRPSLTRLGAVVEQVAELHRSGKEVILVSSGAVGMGKRLMLTQSQMNMSFADLNRHDENGTTGGLMGIVDDGNDEALHLVPSNENLIETGDGAMKQSDSNSSNLSNLGTSKSKTHGLASAAAGQFGMMNLYSSLFDQFELNASQLLFTQLDFSNENSLRNLRYAINRLLSVGIIPIINENDAVSGNLGYEDSNNTFSDNDSLAALCAQRFDAEVLLLLTDVDGVYDRPLLEKGFEDTYILLCRRDECGNRHEKFAWSRRHVSKDQGSSKCCEGRINVLCVCGGKRQ